VRRCLDRGHGAAPGGTGHQRATAPPARHKSSRTAPSCGSGRIAEGGCQVMTADPILRLEAVSKRFGGLRVIEDLTLAVRRGVRTALIGPNGAGKTTVFNLITGVFAVDAGRIVLDGADITAAPSRRRIGHGIARSFQNIRLMPHLSTLENVM